MPERTPARRDCDKALPINVGQFGGMPELGARFRDLPQLLQKIVARLDPQILPSSAAGFSARWGWRTPGLPRTLLPTAPTVDFDD